MVIPGIVARGRDQQRQILDRLRGFRYHLASRAVADTAAPEADAAAAAAGSGGCWPRGGEGKGNLAARCAIAVSALFAAAERSRA